MQNRSLSTQLVSISMFILASGGLAAVIIGFAGEWNWFADLFSHLRPQYCLWLALTAAISFMLRRRISAALAIIGLALNGFALFPYAHSGAEPNTAAVGRTWTLVTINLLQGNREPKRVLQFLRDTHPDIVAFQEVSDRWAGELDSLRDLFPSRYIQPSKDQFGVALFSKEEPIEQSVEQVGVRPSDFAIFGTWISQDRRLNVAGIHPDKPNAEWKALNRAGYLKRVADWAIERHQRGEVVVVMGDFNATPWSASVGEFQRRTGFRNANAGRIFSASWNVWHPEQLLIDHAFLSPGLVLLHSTIGPDVGSDHHPLVIRTLLPAER